MADNKLSQLASSGVYAPTGSGEASKAINTVAFDRAYKKYLADEIANDREPLDKESFIKQYGS